MYNQEIVISELLKSVPASDLTLEQQLIDAKKEIDDLKLHIKWLERAYE